MGESHRTKPQHQTASHSQFASFLGYNPVQTLSNPATLAGLTPSDAAFLTGRSFFPALISGPFTDGLAVASGFPIIACLVAAVASALRWGQVCVR